MFFKENVPDGIIAGGYFPYVLKILGSLRSPVLHNCVISEDSAKVTACLHDPFVFLQKDPKRCSCVVHSM